ncbi:MAG: hypothetical protein HKN87_23835 [Saprospiraceae bacterium]|nr:hypothetical protein [Saprospiraceae bacterium]
MNELYSILIFGVIISACTDDRDAIAQQIIASRIQERLQTYISIEVEKCWQEMHTEASLTADSLIRLDPILVKLDSLQRPPKPVKPNMPAFQRKKDSIEIAPLLIDPQEGSEEVERK